MRPSLSNTFIFWLSIYLFIFNFFGKNVLECASLFFKAAFCREGEKEPAFSLPTSEVFHQPQVDLGADNLHFWSHCSSLKKKLDGAQKRAAIRASAIPLNLLLLLLPSLRSFRFCFQFYLDFFGGCFSHETWPSPDLYCNFLVWEWGEHSARRGLGRPGECANSGLRWRRKVKALFKTIARLILLFILSFPNNRNTA